MDITSLEQLYIDSCKRQEVSPNPEVLSWLLKAKIQKSCQGKCSIVVLLDQLKDVDIPPLTDVFLAIDSSDIDAVDIVHELACDLNEEYIFSLINAVKRKLQVVDLRNISPQKDFLRGLCHSGLACHVLNLRSTHIQKLNMVGSFEQLLTLNLDFCTSLTSLQKDCFSCMPNLMRLSMCETRVADLWTTTAALLKLPSLVELQFQNYFGCKHAGLYCASSGKKEHLVGERLGVLNSCAHHEAQSAIAGDIVHAASSHEAAIGLLSLEESFMVNRVHSRTDGSSEAELSSYVERVNLLEVQEKHECPVSTQNQDVMDVNIDLNKCSWHHPSPICFEKHYREFMVASLPHLEVLDNIPIRKMEREAAKIIYSRYYEYLPYKHKHKESVVNILQKREMGTGGIYCRNSSKLKQSYPYGKSQSFFSRSLIAAKLGSSAWPLLHSVSNFTHMHKGERKRLRPRQFEYHPSNSILMVFGTLDGEIVILNHEDGKIAGYIPSVGEAESVLGLCWLNKYPSKLVAGFDKGQLKLFDINCIPPRDGEICYSSSSAVTFEDFEQLTSVHVNSTDDQFLASGYSKGVALYDIRSGTRLQTFTNMHKEPINVAKFAHHSPFMFATSSFDNDVKMWDLRQRPVQPCYTASSSRGNVMVCFSPDDLYLLVSAIDNEVKQLLAVDGRLHMRFDIASTGSAHNYTRSYYMNGRDYIISGSCDEHAIRICCGQTGRRLRDVCLEDKELGSSMFVQSLRGDPFRHFHFSVLAASMRPTSKQEIIKVNLLASSDYGDEYAQGQDSHFSCGLGG